MKKPVWICLAVFVTLSLTACQKSEYAKKMEESKDSAIPIVKEMELDGDSFEEEFLNEAPIKVADKNIKLDKTEIMGMVFTADGMLLVDGLNSQLIILSPDGTVLEKKGKLGSSPGEFQNPTGITKDDTYIYVLDDGNNRIQLFDMEMEYVKEITIDKSGFEAQTIFRDLAVNGSGDIYMSGDTILNPGIVFYSAPDYRQEHIEENFCGFLSSYEGKIYALTSGQIYLPSDSEAYAGFGLHSGACTFLSVDGKKMTRISSLEGQNYTNDFIMSDNVIYCTNSTYAELQRFETDGNYSNSLGQFDEGASFNYVAEDDEGQIYVSNGNDQIMVFAME
ncbi:hypothetical protein CE91St62_35340 [Lachnospiraceae bacterium]|uniref:6-bladed beta-propeller n=1 Tax=Extibacter sp. GGCC_0201 TaxID=2731209 RepID=UPI001AA1A396|nr:6-bladed beta-propeller [Extibacter sp. GGCC_0201]MBO1721089.1 6-bladed beta-propeller [Extibacter sp. GGCC_0201]BDF35471.1 hypothetical protein CE91St61_35460 [Lachnospiraceae bacterium]BDF39473.1 hypothetical protein CE91St62_35340 [Lachnospiraceae bacterium]